MVDVTLDIFANFQINDEERFARLKDSFLSFKDVNARKWIINVRGRYRDEVAAFLTKHLADKLSVYMLNSGRGWFHDTRKMLPEIASDYVLFWIEDHLNLADVCVYDAILSDMQANDIDVLAYSWFESYARRRFGAIEKGQTKNIEFFRWDDAANAVIQQGEGSYIIGVCSIFKARFFKSIIESDHPLLRRWDPRTPFDFEKNQHDVRWLPFNQAIPRFELFGVIDDDNSGPSLQSRGLYPARVPRSAMIEASYGKASRAKRILPAVLVKMLAPFAVYCKRIGYTARYYFSSRS